MTDYYAIAAVFWLYAAGIVIIAACSALKLKNSYPLVTAVGSAAISAHIIAIITRYFFMYFPNEVYKKYVPVNTLVEGIGFLGLCILFCIVYFKIYKRFIAVFNTAYIISFLCAGTAYIFWQPIPLIAPPYQTFWMSSYMIMMLIGGALGTLAFIFLTLGAFYEHPSAPGGIIDTYAELSERFVRYAFPFITAGILFRACWSNLAWGDWWQWSTDEVLSLTAWVCYWMYGYGRKHYPRAYFWFNTASVFAYACLMASLFGKIIIGFSIYKNF
jgi:ABC-type transport system involved in cytochrome c biogenesis permease subunit